jgi:hypothetical protein
VYVYARACVCACMCMCECGREVLEHSQLILLHILTFLLYTSPATSFIARSGWRQSTVWRLGKIVRIPVRAFSVCVFSRALRLTIPLLQPLPPNPRRFTK